jgi:maltose O-acetyltransferase
MTDGSADGRRAETVNERQKMLLGEPYDASDSALVADRVRARRLTRRLNVLDPDDQDERVVVLRDLLGDLGVGAWVEAPFYCDYGSQIRLGARVFVNMGCIFLDAAPITLDDDVQLGPAVQLLTSDHPRDAASRAAGLESAHPISIGAGGWLGGGVIALPGVDIGADSVIGAGSVVTKSVASGVVAAGNPCRVISGSDRPL